MSETDLAVAGVVAALLLGLIPGFIAQGKGHGFFTYWLGGAAFFPLGLYLAIRLTNKHRAALRLCPYCRSAIPREATVCRFCGRESPSEERRPA